MNFLWASTLRQWLSVQQTAHRSFKKSQRYILMLETIEKRKAAEEKHKRDATAIFFIFGSVWFVIPCIAGLVSIIYLFFGQKRRLKKVIASDDIKAAEIWLDEKDGIAANAEELAKVRSDPDYILVKKHYDELEAKYDLEEKEKEARAQQIAYEHQEKLFDEIRADMSVLNTHDPFKAYLHVSPDPTLKNK